MDTWDDATWILTSTFIIFTMQSGFGLLESGSVSKKNEVNIMVKNSVDVVFGSISYWMIGYGLSFGSPSFHGLFGTSQFFLSTTDPDTLGHVFAHFFFQSSFATTATTIVSGSVAERANFLGYIVFSFFNTFVYAFPAHWIWHEDGFLNKEFGAIDFAGSGAVHLLGGITALTAAIMIGARTKRWTHPEKFRMDCPVNALLGLFMLWWGWLGFNCGSTYGVAGGKWKLASKSAVTTINSSIGGGIVAFAMTYFLQNGKFDVSWIINGILGGLVSITSICPGVSPAESFLIGAIGACIVILTSMVVPKLKIDDPVGAFSVHGAAGVWSLIAVGIFANKDPTEEGIIPSSGLIHGGGFNLLKAQCLYILCCIGWATIATFFSMKIIDLTIGIRCSYAMEVFGADLMEHNIGGYFDHKIRKIYDSRHRLVGVIEKKATNEEIDALYENYIISDQSFEDLDQILNHLPQATNNKIAPSLQNDSSVKPIAEVTEVSQIMTDPKPRKPKTPVRQISHTNANFLDDNFQELETVPDVDQTKL